MNVPTTLKTIFYPIKHINYYEKYIDVWKIIQEGQNTRLNMTIKALNYLILYKLTHLLYLVLHPNLSPLENALQFNVVYLIVPRARLNLMAAFTCLLTVYFNNIFFFQANTQVNAFLESILIHQNDSFFIWKHYKHRSICKLTRQIFVVMSNLMQSLVISGGTNKGICTKND